MEKLKIWFDKFMNGFIDIAELPTYTQEVLFHTN